MNSFENWAGWLALRLASLFLTTFKLYKINICKSVFFPDNLSSIMCLNIFLKLTFSLICHFAHLFFVDFRNKTNINWPFCLNLHAVNCTRLYWDYNRISDDNILSPNNMSLSIFLFDVFIRFLRFCQMIKTQTFYVNKDSAIKTRLLYFV